MNSYRPKISPRRKKFADLIGRVHLEIGNAVHDWQKETGKSKSDLARALEVDKAVLSRRLNGTSNMTLRTIADLAWALGRDIEFSLIPTPDRLHNAVRVVSMEDQDYSGEIPGVFQAKVVHRTGA